jgi:hypothetical protein
MMLFAYLAFVKRLFRFAIYVNMAEPVASEAHILLRATLGFVGNRKAIETHRSLGAHCFIMPHFIALKANNIIFVVAKIVVGLKIHDVFLLLLRISLWTCVHICVNIFILCLPLLIIFLHLL